ncbi:hypothetical protein ACFXAF_33660, partial [Kitasatospora sp. NPDC059463]|uniref:hypothetical protein n=1 Tax=Kitasatospora sp. NPDC059463 TaxID=3346842 RepID=UPI00368BE89D
MQDDQLRKQEQEQDPEGRAGARRRRIAIGVAAGVCTLAPVSYTHHPSHETHQDIVFERVLVKG